MKAYKILWKKTIAMHEPQNSHFFNRFKFQSNEFVRSLQHSPILHTDLLNKISCPQ